MSISFKKLLFRHMESMIATFFLNKIYETDLPFSFKR